MIKQMRRCAAPVLLALALLSCDFQNLALDEGTSISGQVASGAIKVSTVRTTPVDAYVCCFSRQSNWGKINDNDLGAFNGYGDYRMPSYIYDGRIDTWWQANYSGENHHDVENWDGRHWVLVDLGQNTTFNILKLNSHKANTTFYQIYASDDRDDLMDPHPGPDNGNPPGQTTFYEAKLGRAGGNGIKPSYDFLIGEGMLDGVDGEKTIPLNKDYTARYVMLRTQIGTASSDRTVDELWVEYRVVEGFEGFDTTVLFTAYNRALLLLKALDRESMDYQTLYNKVFVTMNSQDTQALSFRNYMIKYTAEEKGIKDMAKNIQFERQLEVDTLVNTLNDYMDRLDPPRKPPEVF
jgi:hypothetical protein